MSIFENMTIKEITKEFNSWEVQDRINYLNSLTSTEKKEFVDKIRNQAVKDFWTHEQELIKNGQSTRNWTAEQIEDILNISEKAGKISINGDITYDINGKAYYGHHMMNVAEHPEYAGDWRNIQALDKVKHNEGKVLLMDNPFAATYSEHLLKPLMKVAKKNNTQLICLTGLGGDSIYGRFDNIYVLNLVSAGLKRDVQYLRTDHVRGSEKDVMVMSHVKVDETEQLTLF